MIIQPETARTQSSSRGLMLAPEASERGKSKLGPDLTNLVLVHVLGGEDAGLCLHDVLDDDAVLLLDLLRHGGHVVLQEVQLLLLLGDVPLQAHDLLHQDLAVRHHQLVCLE